MNLRVFANAAAASALPTATETVNVNTGKNTKNSASKLFPNRTSSSKAKTTSCLIQTAREIQSRPHGRKKRLSTRRNLEMQKERREPMRSSRLRTQPKA
mmetsp:Transcript_3520/g.5368  ORF Transcript_3520/g.5368 Transcript_3520/m.5368 type:complete len:99 (-) Transcript_3520:975-1271(-)